MLFRSDRKSTRLNSSHTIISYAVFCLKKKYRRAGARQQGARARTPTEDNRLPPRGRWRVSTPALTETAYPRSATVGRVILFFLMNRLPPSFTLFPHRTPSP